TRGFEIVSRCSTLEGDDVHAARQHRVVLVVVLPAVVVGARLAAFARAFARVSSVALLTDDRLVPLGNAELESNLERGSPLQAVGLTQRCDGHVVAIGDPAERLPGSDDVR